MEFQPCGVGLRHTSIVAAFDTRNDAEYRNSTREAHGAGLVLSRRRSTIPTWCRRTISTRVSPPISAHGASATPAGRSAPNVPQLGGWHSATDMHLRAEFTELTLEIFELIQGVFADQGLRRRLRAGLRLDVGERQPARRLQSPPHPSARAVERGLLRPHPGRLRPVVPHRSASPGARDHPVLRFQAPLRAYLGRGLLPAGGRPAHRLSRMARTFHAPEHGGCRFGADRGSGRGGTERDGEGRPCGGTGGGRPRRRTDQRQLHTSGSGARTPAGLPLRPTRW